jgi:hypothetical protein
MSLICRFRTEQEKAFLDTVRPGRSGEREYPKRLEPRGAEYRCEVRRRTGS